MTRPRWAACSAAAALLLYLAFPAARYNFDGVACAIAVELGDIRHLLHGNHLAYGLLGGLFELLFRLARVPIPALQSLQLLSSLLGAATVGVFAWTLMECGAAPGLAVAGAMGLAVSKVFWIWSLEAQVYPLGALFAALSLAALVRRRPDPVGAGLLNAGAVLGHVGHVMLAPAGLSLVSGTRARLRYAAALASGVLAAYLAAAPLMALRSWGDLRVWILGSAALAVDRSFSWHGGYSLAGLASWLRLSFSLAGGGFLGGASLIAAAAWGGRRAWRTRRPLVGAMLIWLGAYALLFLSWEPYTPVYRVTDLLPLWLLACLGLEGWRKPARLKTAVLGAAVAALGLYNLVDEIVPASKPENNRELQRVLWEARETPADAWLLADGIDQVYLPYFADRRFVNLRYFEGREDRLRERIEAIRKDGHLVFAVPQALPARWRKWREGRRAVGVAREGGWELVKLMP